MKKNLNAALILFGLLNSVSTFAASGGESHAGGADDYRIVPAFFRSERHEKPIEACYVIAEGFGLDAAAIEPMIRDSFSQWANYIKVKKLTIVRYSNWIQTRMNLHANCTGNENLRFLFGVQSEEIAHYSSQFSKPFGFAQLTGAGWDWDDKQPAKGFIWIAPPNSVDAVAKIPKWDQSTRPALQGLILHELGHVFGNGHVDGTVMTEKIGQYLENDTSNAQTAKYVSLYSKIDAQIELVPCMDCYASYSAAETFDPIQLPGRASSDWEWAFKMLTGKDAGANILIRYERMGSPQGSGRLTVMDESSSFSFPVDISWENGELKQSTPLFSGQGGMDFYSCGISYTGQIKSLSGATLPVIVNYNMDGKKAEILVPGTGFYLRPIFVSAD
ncbi:MAG: hypothetical protein H7222_10535 [Methylotenera sp.]|nr:hypothetical protein [Oligoflexia bacterium]